MAKNNFFEEPQEQGDQKIILPRHNKWIWPIVFFILVVLAGLGFWYTQTQHNQVVQPNVTDFASCADVGGQIMESFPEQCAYNGKSYTNQDQTDPQPEEKPEPVQNLKTYTDTTNQFSFSYPDTLVQTEADVNTPYTAPPVPVTSQIFAHTIPVEYCNLKGDCIPNTTDFSISFTVVNSNIAKISASPKMAGMADATVGANKFKMLEMGAEGEGIVYYFIALPSGKTLMISQKYMDENILSKYKTADGFITRKAQDELAEQILTSLKFTATTSN